MRYLLCLLLVSGFISPLSFASEPVQIITFNAPPYSVHIAGELNGFATETVKAMLKELRINRPISVYPLKRGLYFASKRPNILVYPVARGASLEDQFYWIGKLSEVKAFFFKHESRKDIQLSSIDDARQYSIGVIRGSLSEAKLRNLGFNNLMEVTDETQNILKLERDRIDLIVSDDLMLHHFIDRHNRTAVSKLDFHQYQKLIALPEDKNDLYIALSKETDAKLADRFIDAYNRIAESGKLIEVAHWWTGKHGESWTNVYRHALQREGYTWVDYTIEGGAGENLNEILQKRMDTQSIPHAIQTYVGAAVQEWAARGELLDLDEIAQQENWKDQLPELIHKKIQHNNHYVAVPANLQRVNWMWINPAIFRKAGVSLPFDWPTFFSAADAIKNAGYTPVAIGGYSWQEGTLFESLVLGVGGTDFYERSLVNLEPEEFRSPTMAKVLEAFRKIGGYTDNRREGRDWVQATEMVIYEEAAIYFMGDWAKSVFEANKVPYGDNGYLCLPVPETDHLFLANSDAFAFPKGEDRYQAGQVALAKAIMDKKVQEEFNLKKSSLPVRLDVPLNRFDQCSQMAINVAREGKLLPSFNFHQTQPAEIQQPIIEIISHFFNSDESISEAQDKLYQLVKNYKKSP